MAVNFNSVSRPNAAGAFLEGPASSPRAASATGFEQQLMAAIGDSLVRAGLTPEQFQIGLAPAAGSNGAAARQIVVTLPAAANPESNRADAPPASTDPANLSPVEVLKAALKSAGLDPDRFSFREIREVVGYPGGSYENHHIAVEVASGVQECYDVALMLRHPEVTVTEIRRLLRTSGIQVA